MNDQPAIVFGPEDFQTETGADDATLKKFSRYHQLILDWNEQAGLIGDSTLGQIWHRHFLDSAQLAPLMPKGEVRVADMGSGAGFPGLVLAILGVPNITLFERNTRKAGFLQEVVDEFKLKVDVLNLTAEDYGGEPFDVLTARALAPLGELLSLSRRLRKPSTICLLLKGKNLDAEIREAQKDWVMPDTRRIQSITDKGSAILRLANVKSAR
jgi:16S rRNA (guanine527-N7)-methyltransferase